MNDITIVPGYTYPQEISTLFTEYTNLLIENDPTFQDYLNLQHYDNELQHLEEKYGLPNGRLYLAFYDTTPAGCIALRQLSPTECEMKRLYVRPQYRGHHISDLLITQLITDAKTIGYTTMLLDTLPFLKSAIHIYKKRGFQEIPSYNNSPMSTSIYMKLNL